MMLSHSDRIGRRSLLLAFFLLVGSFSACGRHLPYGDAGRQAYYRTGYPDGDVSEVLERAFTAVVPIRIEAIYETYSFAPESAPTAAEVGSPIVLQAAAAVERSNQERGATGVAISRAASGNVALLTANHALEFPDTIIVHYDDGNDSFAPSGSRRVQAVAIKRGQANWIVTETQMLNFETLARDPVRDLALIGVSDPEPDEPEFPLPVEPFQRPAAVSLLRVAGGDSQRLSWGSFVYVLGYPQGHPMVTRGVVSAPGFTMPGAFLVDGLWNRGMSGGLILAVRGDGSGLEWVGVARGAAASTEIRLVPEEGALPDPGVRRVYEGSLYLEETRRIDYGITFSVPINDIRQFLSEQRGGVEARGYQVPRI
jgi:hypothetical protein